MSAGKSLHPLQAGVPMVVVACQHEIPVDSIRGDKLPEQRRRKLDAFTGGAARDHMPGRPAIVIQILLRRDAKVKFVSVHGITIYGQPKLYCGERGAASRNRGQCE